MRVRDEYNIDELIFEELAQSGNPYWENAFKFYEDVHDRFAGSISQAQYKWLDKIEEQIEKIKKGERR